MIKPNVVLVKREMRASIQRWKLDLDVTGGAIPATQTICHSAEYPSRITLPVIPR